MNAPQHIKIESDTTIRSLQQVNVFLNVHNSRIQIQIHNRLTRIQSRLPISKYVPDVESWLIFILHATLSYAQNSFQIDSTNSCK